MPSKDIMIVDDDFALTLSLEELLTEEGYHVVAKAYSDEEALLKARATRPRLILMDIRLGNQKDGIDVALQLLEELNIRSMFITGHDDRELLERAKACRPLGYILKPIDDRQLLAELEIAVYKVEAERERDVFNNREFPDELPPRFADFTPTELRVAALIRQGKTSKEVAGMLSVGEGTIEWHRKNIRRKLHLKQSGENLTKALLS